MTEFERKVYRAVAGIPLGQTRTYAWVARRVKTPGAVRAVGQALRKNPFPLLIPCHRVIRSDGRSGGYRWGGTEKKMRLIRLEQTIAQWLKTSR